MPLDARQRVDDFRIRIVLARIKHGQPVAILVNPGPHMREADAVVESEPARDLPGILGVEFYRHVPHAVNRIAVRLPVLPNPPHQHIGISIARAVATPTGIRKYAIGVIAGRLIVRRVLPIEAELHGMRTPQLGDVIRNRGKHFLGVERACSLESAGLDDVANSAAPAGHAGDHFRIGIEDALIGDAQYRGIHFLWIVERIGQIEISPCKDKLVGERRAENMCQIRGK